MKKRFLSALLAAVCCLSLSAPARAAEGAPSAHATYWVAPFIVEGHDVAFLDPITGRALESINYNGNIYIPLSSAGEMLSLNMAYNSAAHTITVTHSTVYAPYYRTYGQVPLRNSEELAMWEKGRKSGFEVSLLPDVTIDYYGTKVQGLSAQGAPLFPMIYGDNVYLPIRTVAQLGGFHIWLREMAYPGETETNFSLYLYTAPSQPQLQAARDYADQLCVYEAEFTAALDALEQEQGLTQELLRARLLDIKAQALRVKDISLPSSPALMSPILQFLSAFDMYMRDTLDYYAAANRSGSTQRDRDMVVGVLKSSLTPPWSACIRELHALADGMA